MGALAPGTRLRKMRRLLQLAAALLLAATLAPAPRAAQAAQREARARRTSNGSGSTPPTTPTKKAARTTSCRTSASTLPRPVPHRAANLLGTPIDGRYRSLANTALDHLTVPGNVLADDNRYVSISGCVVHFCPARGLLWIDLNGAHHLVVFAAIDWVKQGKPTTDPAAEYTLWLFPDDPLSVAGNGPHPPPALTGPRALGRRTASRLQVSCRTSPTPSWSTPTARPTRSPLRPRRRPASANPY